MISILSLKSKRRPFWAFLVDLPSWRALFRIALSFSLCVLFITIAVFHDWRYSPLNKSSALRTQSLHDKWLESARSFFADLPPRNSTMPPRLVIGGADASRISTALVVMASKRRVPYVQAWAWSLLSGSSSRELNQSLVTIINTQRPPSANSVDLQPLVDAGIRVTDMYAGKTEDRRPGVPKLWSDWILDGYLCHIQALVACDQAGAPWCIIFEEDSVLTRDFLAKFRSLVMQGMATHPAVQPTIGMVKLFTTDAWKGFQWPSWPKELILIPGCLAAVLVIPLGYLISRIKRAFFTKRRCAQYSRLPSAKRTRNKILIGKLVLIFTVVFGNILLSAVLAGRQSLISMFTTSEVHLIPCTTAAFAVAVAFPLEVTRALKDHMLSLVHSKVQPSVPADLEIFGWAKDHGYTLLQSSPSLAQHIGMYSSNPAKYMSTYVNQDSRFTF